MRGPKKGHALPYRPGRWWYDTGFSLVRVDLEMPRREGARVSGPDPLALSSLCSPHIHHHYSEGNPALFLLFFPFRILSV